MHETTGLNLAIGAPYMSSLTSSPPLRSTARDSTRVDWVDYAKGLCIILVVMMHVTLRYGEDVGREGWLHDFVLFAQPFRMPDFFLISGLFLSRSINVPWREYFDRKVLHFVYFYVLWLAIQLTIVEASLLVTQPLAFVGTFLRALIEPINTLWFVHMLAIFYLVTRWLRAIPAPIVFVAAAALHTAYIAGIIPTDSVVVTEFSNRYVFFYSGYVAAPLIFEFARRVGDRPRAAVCGLLVWAIVNGAMAVDQLHFWPVLSLVMGFSGAAAIVAAGSLLAQRDWAWALRYAGINSIVIYLTFFLPKGVLTRVALATVPDWDVAWVSLVITLVAVVTPLLFHRFIQETLLAFLYVRPAAFRLVPGRRPQSANDGDGHRHIRPAIFSPQASGD
jgi:uncharacterized membrane protein YcfT